LIWGKTKYFTDICRRWQHILSKLPALIGVARRTITSFEVWYCFIAGDVLDDIIQHTQQLISITQHHVSHANDDQITGEMR